MIIRPRIRGFVCATAHPEGCAANVQDQIDFVHSCPRLVSGPRNVLVIGSSTGYGLATRIVAGFGCGAGTLGVSLERPPDVGRTASAGWYNNLALERRLHAQGLYAASVDGDAFTDAVKHAVLERIARELGRLDLIVYSLAAPRRTHPETGAVHRSVIKPIGQALTNKSVDVETGRVSLVTLEPATEAEIADTVAVMGGDDWERWIRHLADADLLAPGARTLAYSYLGPELTRPIYHDGTIEQVYRLFSERLLRGAEIPLDSCGRIRLDEQELRSDVQDEVARLWEEVTTDNLTALSDIEGYRREFLGLFGFAHPGLDYDLDVDPFAAQSM